MEIKKQNRKKLYFKLDWGKGDKKINLVICNINNEKLERKLSLISLIKAYSKKSIEDNCEYFLHNNIVIYK